MQFRMCRSPRAQYDGSQTAALARRSPSARCFRSIIFGACFVGFPAVVACSGGDVGSKAQVTTELVLEREKKLSTLVGEQSYALGASGIALREGFLYIVLDDATALAVVDPALTGGRLTEGMQHDSNYEGITSTDGPSPKFYVAQETDGHGRGTVVALDVDPVLATTQPTDVLFENDNKGLEGIAFTRIDGEEYLLALCEGNFCGPSVRTAGGGRIKVLAREGNGWSTRATLNMPPSIEFADYADLALWDQGDGSYLAAVVSQESSALWLGSISTRPFAIVGPGRVLSPPRTSHGKVRYCELEGVTFLDRSTVAMVSDRTKQTNACAETDQSVHVFRFPE